MASMLAARRIAATNPLQKLLFPTRTISPSSAAAAASAKTRSFNTSAQTRAPVDERGLEIDRRRGDAAVSPRRPGDILPSLFRDVLDPFSPSRSLSQVLNLMDQLMEAPVSAPMGAVGARRGWDAREDADGLYLRLDMPGLGKEDVKVTVENNTLVIKGEGEKEAEEEDGGRRYSSRIDLPAQVYKTDQIRAEMKNGVLKVFVPKVKEEERKDVRLVNVE